MNENEPKTESETLNEDKPKNEPETLCIAWLSSCQRFHLMQDLYIIAVNSVFNSLETEEQKIIDALTKNLMKAQKEKNKFNLLPFIKSIQNADAIKPKKVKKFFKKILRLKNKKEKIDVIVQKLLDSVKCISPAPIVGAVAVKYKHDNSFSVFIGIGMGMDEDADIAYIKRMGQRTTEQIARGIFPQFDDMAYHN